MPELKVARADFIKNDDRRADKASSALVTITKNGHDRLVVLAGELADKDVTLIAKAEVPAEYTHLDAELKD